MWIQRNYLCHVKILPFYVLYPIQKQKIKDLKINRDDLYWKGTTFTTVKCVVELNDGSKKRVLDIQCSPLMPKGLGTDTLSRNTRSRGRETSSIYQYILYINIYKGKLSQ